MYGVRKRNLDLMKVVSTHPHIKSIAGNSAVLFMSGNRSESRITFNALVDLEGVQGSTSSFIIRCIGVRHLGVFLPDVLLLNGCRIETLEANNYTTKVCCMFEWASKDHLWYVKNTPNCPDWMKADVFMKYPDLIS